MNSFFRILLAGGGTRPYIHQFAAAIFFLSIFLAGGGSRPCIHQFATRPRSALLAMGMSRIGDKSSACGGSKVLVASNSMVRNSLKICRLERHSCIGC